MSIELVVVVIAFILLIAILPSLVLIKLTIAILFAVTLINALTKVRDNVYEWLV